MSNAGDDRRVQQLRQLLLSQLDLIQKQSDALANKDQQLTVLQQDNERLHKRMASMQATASKKAAIPKVEQPQPPPVETVNNGGQLNCEILDFDTQVF